MACGQRAVLDLEHVVAASRDIPANGFLRRLFDRRGFDSGLRQTTQVKLIM
jgi:hypothetical protein